MKHAETNTISRATTPPKRYSRKIIAFLDKTTMGKWDESVGITFQGDDGYRYHVNIDIDFMERVLAFYYRED